MKSTLRKVSTDRAWQVEMLSRTPHSGVSLRLVESSAEVVAAQAIAGDRAAGGGPRLGALGQLVSTWLGRSRQRRALRELPDWLLEDIGVTAEQALQESGKPFWQG